MNCLDSDRQIIFQSFYLLYLQVPDTSKNYAILAQKSQGRNQQIIAHGANPAQFYFHK